MVDGISAVARVLDCSLWWVEGGKVRSGVGRRVCGKRAKAEFTSTRGPTLLDSNHSELLSIDRLDQGSLLLMIEHQADVQYWRS